MAHPIDDQESAEEWRTYMADQADQQTRALREIANSTAWTKTLTIVLLGLLVLWVFASVFFGSSGRL